MLGCLAGNRLLFIIGRSWNFPRHDGALRIPIIYTPIIVHAIMRETAD